MACDNNTRLHVWVSLIGVTINVLHLNILLFQRSFTKVFGKLNTNSKIRNTNFIKNFTLVIESRLVVAINKKYFCVWKNRVDWSNSKQRVISCLADPFYVATYLNHVLFISDAKSSMIADFTK